MPYEDFLTYDETDQNNNVTVSSSKISWEDMRRSDLTHVSDSKGAAYFDGDFEHKFECQFSDINYAPIVGFWALANVQLAMKPIQDAGEDAAHFYQFEDSLVIQVTENGTPGDSESWQGAESTTYYITLSRNDDGGANSTGQYIAEIRTDSHTGTLQTTLTCDCAAGEQNDFEFIFGLMNSGSTGVLNTSDGFTQNLDLQGNGEVGAGAMTLRTGYWGQVVGE